MSSSRRGIASCLAAVAMLCAAAPTHANVPHTVQPGETLWSIAARQRLEHELAGSRQRPFRRGAA